MGYRRLRLPIIVIAVATFVVGFAPWIDNSFQPPIQFAIKDAIQVAAILTMAIAAIWAVERGIEQSAAERKRASQQRSLEELQRWVKDCLDLIAVDKESLIDPVGDIRGRRYTWATLKGKEEILNIEIKAFGEEWENNLKQPFNNAFISLKDFFNTFNTRTGDFTTQLNTFKSDVDKLLKLLNSLKEDLKL